MNVILVRRGTRQIVAKAIRDHAAITLPVVASVHRCRLRPAGEDLVVTFEPELPLYSLTNLIAWLGDPGVGAGSTVGWITSPATGERFYLWPDDSNPAGDTLCGVSDRGRWVVVYLPDTTVQLQATGSAEAAPEPAISPTILDEFAIVSDSNPDFGNPSFQVSS